MMQSTSEGCMNIAELAHQLRREKIFINSERQLLQKLNEEVESKALELLQASWVCSMQRQNLTNLITSRCEVDSIAACQRASLLERATFVDIHKVAKFKESNALAELLGWLRDSPHLVALCLLLGEDHMPANLPAALVAGLYGSCRTSDDRTRLLAVMRLLIKYQLVPSGDPRKLLRSSKCAFASLFAVVRDGHSPARQFLVAALQAPVMAVLHEDEFFLDIDPDKAMERFSPQDRVKKFGQPGSSEYAAKVARYRKWTVQSLYNLTSKVIGSLRDHWHTFPAVLAWLIQQIVQLLKQHSRTSERELHSLCTELILNQFICPALVNPEAHGVVDVPVSYIARFNLIQIAQIIQMLCLSKYQEVDGKCRDVYARFERGCVWWAVERVCAAAALPEHHHHPPQPPHALLAVSDHNQLLNFLRRISSKLNNNTPSVTAEEQCNLGSVEAAFSETSSECSSSSEACAGRLAALLHTLEPNYRGRLHDLLKKMPDLTKYRPSPPVEPKEPILENGHSIKKVLAKVPKPRLPRSASSNSSLALSDDKPVNGNADREESTLEHIEVLVIKLASTEESDYVGLIPESKVLECYYGGSEAGDEPAPPLAPPGQPAQQKRTRFSVSHDEVSLGNTSDNLEAVSEAASNHSVTSSLELETEDQNDNLSDMVSANVSGRGSPNISGRETPSSQVTDGDPPDMPARRLPQNAPVNQPSSSQAKLLKQTRNEIEDKFCKFEIRKLVEGDETISIMSDTWSTDVLASDSETIGDSCEHTQVPNTAGGGANSSQVPDVSETASESAWSVDVLASDSDRNTEVDTDDCVSVAARSDTSWPRRPDCADEYNNQNGSARRSDVGSPRRASRPSLTNRSGGSAGSSGGTGAGGGYLCATQALSRGGELDLPPHHQHNHYSLQHRKSILVNGYPVMTCYATSAPESPSTSAPVAANDVFHFHSQNREENASGPTESTLEGEGERERGGGAAGDATSQWVDDSFPQVSFGAPRSASSSSAGEAAEGGDAGEGGAEVGESAAVGGDSAEGGEGDAVGAVCLQLSRARLQPPAPAPPTHKHSTGAIPKSISFDATAEKSQRRRIGEDSLAGLDELKNNVRRSGGNLLNKIKMFRQKGRQQTQNDVKPTVDESRGESSREAAPVESSEEILAKYRRKGSADTKRRPSRHADNTPPEIDRAEGVMDLNDPEAFDSVKRKLRMVLSNPDLHCMDYVPSRSTSTSLCEWVGACGGPAAGALARVLRGAGGAGARVAAALRADVAARRPYAAYLAQCRAALLHHRHTLDNETRRVRAEGEWCCGAAATARALDHLERTAALRRLARLHTAPPSPGGEPMDEKATRLNASIKAITAEVKADPAFEGACSVSVEAAETAVERAAYARLYLHVLFPNGDGDIARDQVLSEHIRRLSANLSASRVGVPAAHLWAVPFAHAQQQLRYLPVYRTPRDKVSCIMRCVNCIMCVLALSEGAPPAADDLTPVLVYVILKVNPPSLLSTIELVQWAGGALGGEALYWWTQFCAAVAYIKTMDYHS